jgi:leader peptidase (prepilin peptidase) / N-methyltransferase
MIAVTMTAAALSFGAFAAAGGLAARAYWPDLPALPDAPPRGEAPMRYLMVAAALLGAVCTFRGASAENLAIVAVMVGVLTAIWCVDATNGIIPDALTIIPLAGLLIAGVLTGHAYVLLAAAVPALPFSFIAWRTKGLGLGWGDVKLAALGGALLGMQMAILAFALAALAAVVIARVQRRSTQAVAFGPYLVAAIACPLAAFSAM